MEPSEWGSMGWEVRICCCAGTGSSPSEGRWSWKRNDKLAKLPEEHEMWR